MLSLVDGMAASAGECDSAPSHVGQVLVTGRSPLGTVCRSSPPH
ncbi:hypothetical protein BZL30_1515 [Mycobacterium kansasii]|uniref:Uncharacterized protein n=1 Tax=Mycobacterium kansasii TaxID=1768 RepID=A0A1V3XS17_MYCKA|nr:hypothetical protein BZL30_1515 [Mycobacterium kansasii]